MGSLKTLALFVFGLLACGGKTSVEPPDANVFDPTDASPPPSIPLVDIPAGYASYGYWRVDPSTMTMVPEGLPCWGPTRFYANAFRLMRTEATFEQYAACFDAGGCPQPDGAWGDAQTTPQAPFPPSVSHEPVSLRWQTARAFCRWLGGDLPTDVQWLRAATGGENTFGVPSLTAAWLRCLAGQSDGLCDAMFHAAPSANGLDVPGSFVLADVGTTAWDVAPFGNVDMFGNAFEWVRTATTMPSDPDFCALTDGDPDPAVAGVELDGGDAWQLAEQQGTYWWLEKDDHDLSTADELGPKTADAPYTGVRCAFP